MSHLRDRRDRHDAFHQKAKREGFAARAVYKLEEIDRKHRLFTAGGRVLDLGCRPGSWLQYARTRVGERGVLVGIDRAPLDIVVPGLRLLVGDVLAVEVAELRGDLPGFDTVLSDLAPDTSGVRALDQARSEALFERALDIAEQTLLPGGAFLGKIFQGPCFTALVRRCRERFARAAVEKPRSSRPDSFEMYVVATGFGAK